jgi:hypothetical protein
MNNFQIETQKMITKLLIATSALLFMAGCTENEFIEKPAAAAPEVAFVDPTGEGDVASVTLSGIYTEIVESVDCATCTFTVPAGMTEVDGVELELGPGSVICIGKGRKLAEVEFVNMIGTEESPITIGRCEE